MATTETRTLAAFIEEHGEDGSRRAMSQNYKLREFRADHLHVVTRKHGHLQESCALHPNWDRCTSDPITLEDYRALPRGGNRDVWQRDPRDGQDRYRKAPLPDEFQDCRDCNAQ